MIRKHQDNHDQETSRQSWLGNIKTIMIRKHQDKIMIRKHH